MYNYRKIYLKNCSSSKCSDFVPKKNKYDVFSLAAVLQLKLPTVQCTPLIDPCSVLHVSLEYFKLILTFWIKSLNPTLDVKHWYKNVHGTQTPVHHTYMFIRRSISMSSRVCLFLPGHTALCVVSRVPLLLRVCVSLCVVLSARDLVCTKQQKAE